MIWVPISKDSRYEVSDTGLVRSWADSHNGHLSEPRALKLQISSSGYAQVRIPVDGGFKWRSVHRLVALAFLKQTGPYVNHLNGVKTDNRVENLEWCDAAHNVQHYVKNRSSAWVHPRPLLGKTDALCKNSKSVVQLRKDGSIERVWNSIAEARRQCGFSAGNISACCRGARKEHAGFFWRFANEVEETT